MTINPLLAWLAFTASAATVVHFTQRPPCPDAVLEAVNAMPANRLLRTADLTISACPLCRLSPTQTAYIGKYLPRDVAKGDRLAASTLHPTGTAEPNTQRFEVSLALAHTTNAGQKVAIYSASAVEPLCPSVEVQLVSVHEAKPALLLKTAADPKCQLAIAKKTDLRFEPLS
jgi:hypothetical protein